MIMVPLCGSTFGVFCFYTSLLSAPSWRRDDYTLLTRQLLEIFRETNTGMAAVRTTNYQMIFRSTRIHCVDNQLIMDFSFWAKILSVELPKAGNSLPPFRLCANNLRTIYFMSKINIFCDKPFVISLNPGKSHYFLLKRPKYKLLSSSK